MISIKDIAKECGVSIATVSKSLNDASDISKETKEKIRNKAQEMGYFVNHSARALKTKRTYNIGVLFDDEITHTITHEFFSWVLDSFKSEAELRGYDITFMNHTIGNEKTTYLNYCRYRGFDGVAIINANYKSQEIKDLVDSGIPCVTVDHMYNNCSNVMSNNKQGLKEEVEYAYKLGHRKIAFIHGGLTSVTKDRIAGYKEALDDLGLEFRKDYLIQGTYHDMKDCAVKTAAALKLKDRPSCIILPDDYSAYGGMQSIAEAGLRVPEDISVMAYDGVRFARYLELTTFSQETGKIGKTAADKLINDIESEESIVEHVIIPGSLIVGTTTGPWKEEK